MTTSLSVRNPNPLRTGAPQDLSVEVKTDRSRLYLHIPLGDRIGTLMTEGEFKDKAEVSIEPAAADVDLPSDYRRVIPAEDGKPAIGSIAVWPGESDPFCILISSFSTNEDPGQVVLRLVDRDMEELACKEVDVISTPPRIVSFVSSHYNGLAGTPVTLSWKIEPPGGYRLLQLPKQPGTAPTEIKIPDFQKAEIEMTIGTDESTSYRLETMAGEDSRILTLHSYGTTQVKSYRGPGDDKQKGLSCGEILGVYNRRDRLYAVVRDGNPKNGASIWWTPNAFDHRTWQPLTTDGETPIRIPTDAASRPGAVFDDKLYFMGGSSYDYDCPGKEVGYFQFETNTWVDGDGARHEAWPKEMPARMGHALLASAKGRQLWVLGGYNGDGGALNDVWVYAKFASEAASKWTKLDLTPCWKPRCFFGATFQGNELWVAGGFDSPGGYPTYDDIWHLDTKNPTGWRKLDYHLTPVPDEKNIQYCGCAMAASNRERGADHPDDEPQRGAEIYTFTAYHVVDQGNLNKIHKISLANNEWQPTFVLESSDWVTPSGLSPVDCYRFDATVLGGCIFVRRLARAETKDKEIHYLVCV